MSLKLEVIGPSFERDLIALSIDGAAARAITLLKLVAIGHLRGERLEDLAGTADLNDCRKLYFDVDAEQPRPRFRLVYRLLPDENVPDRVQAIAVGYRKGLDAYLRAARNLGRL